MIDFGLSDVVLAIAATIFAWWAGTAALLVLDRRAPGGAVAAGVLTVAVGLLGLYGAWASASTTTQAAAYVGFASGLALWAALEFAFLSGWITGPERRPCPEGADTLLRFGLAVRALLHHELSLLAGAAALFAVSQGAPNLTALLTFCVLWAMRASAKLNIFLGVPNLTTEFLPARLDYLASYFRTASFNALFPVSVTLGAAAAMAASLWAAGAAPGSFDRASWTLVATLLWLGVLEHWFLVLPVPDAALWRWLLNDKPLKRLWMKSPGSERLKT